MYPFTLLLYIRYQQYLTRVIPENILVVIDLVGVVVQDPIFMHEKGEH
jgi:hypothetical protein